MMSIMSKLGERFSSPNALLLLLGAVVIVGSTIQYVGPRIRPGGPQPVELELTRHVATFQQILRDWRDTSTRDVMERARRAVWIDFLFIACYVPFLSGLYIWLVQTRGVVSEQPHALPVIAPWMAGILDVIENALLLFLIPQQASQLPASLPTAVHLLFLVAALKWTLIVLSVSFCAIAFFGGTRGRVLELVRYSLLSVAFGSVPLMLTGQGQDLLVGLGESGSWAHWIFFTLAGWLWALSVWYWSRLLLDAGFGGASSSQSSWAKNLPRVLGALTLALPTIGFWLARNRFSRAIVPYELMVGGAVSVVLFLSFVIRRRRYLARNHLSGAKDFRNAALPLSAKVTLVGSLGCSLALLASVLWSPINFPNQIGATPILALAAANLVFLGSIAVFASHAWRVPVDVIALLCAAAFSLWNDNHAVRPVPAASASPRDAFAATFTAWAEQPDRVNKPVILVTAEGGGIRAAYWTAAVLARLEPERANRIFTISGVSGGAVGAAVFGALLHDGHQPIEFKNVLAHPLLAPVLAKLVTGDFLQWFLPIPIEAVDRSKAFEEGLAEAYYLQTNKNTFRKPFLELWSGKSSTPALLFTSTSVEHGARVIISPYRWSDRRADRLDIHELVEGDLTLAQAAHNSARFSYVSPVGQLVSSRGEAQGGLVDGGYFENSGAETLLDVIGELRSSARPPSQIEVLFICSSPGACPDFRPSSIASSPWVPRAALGELLGPIRTLYRTRDAHADLALRRLLAVASVKVVALCSGSGDPDTPEPPLGWDLSTWMKDKLDHRIAALPATEPCTPQK